MALARAASSWHQNLLLVLPALQRSTQAICSSSHVTEQLQCSEHTDISSCRHRSWWTSSPVFGMAQSDPSTPAHQHCAWTRPQRNQPSRAMSSMAWATSSPHQFALQPCPLHLISQQPSQCVASSQWPGQWRSYKSIKKSMKPVYVQASRMAAAPYLRRPPQGSRFKQAPIVDTAVQEIPSVPCPPGGLFYLGFGILHLKTQGFYVSVSASAQATYL